MPDKSNCKKFYRCVDNGKGNYTKYDFDCPEGTAWSQDLETCDYADKTGCVGKSETTTSTTTASTTPSDTTTTGSTEQTTSEGTTTKPTTTTSSSSTSTEPTTTSKPQPNDGVCREEGFIGDDKDCHKFHRCVDDGKGGLTKYDFTCAEGTAWSSELTTCDYEENVNCSSSSNTTTTAPPPPCNTTESSSTTTESTTTESSTSK